MTDVGVGAGITSASPTGSGARAPAHFLAVVVAVAAAALSVAGLLFGSGLYAGDRTTVAGVATGPAGVLVPGFAAQDLLNLVIGIPVLFVCLALARRGALFAELLLAGAVFNVLYVYTHYLIGAPLSVGFVAYALLIALSAYALAGIVVTIDRALVQATFARIPARAIGGTLIVFALLTCGQDLYGALAAASGAAAEAGARRVWGADFAIATPAMLAGGVLLWRRAALGFIAAPGLLLSFAMFSAEIAVMIALQPQLTGRPGDLGTAVGLLIFGVAGLVPLALLMRAVATNGLRQRAADAGRTG